jgi:hypothetical protein
MSKMLSCEIPDELHAKMQEAIDFESQLRLCTDTDEEWKKKRISVNRFIRLAIEKAVIDAIATRDVHIAEARALGTELEPKWQRRESC